MSDLSPLPAEAGPHERRQWVDERRESLPGGRTDVLRGSPTAAVHADGWDARHWSSRLIHRISAVASHAATAILACALVTGWAVVGIVSGFPRWWQTSLYSVTASVTFVMVFVIQHAQERQTFASQRKLDELIRSSSQADDTLIAVEEADDRYLQALASLNYSDRALAAERDPDH